MDIIILIIIVYLIGESIGKNKGHKEKKIIDYSKGYKDGINKVENEIIEMDKLDDKEIIIRIRKLMKRKKGV